MYRVWANIPISIKQNDILYAGSWSLLLFWGCWLDKAAIKHVSRVTGTSKNSVHGDDETSTTICVDHSRVRMSTLWHLYAVHEYLKNVIIVQSFNVIFNNINLINDIFHTLEFRSWKSWDGEQQSVLWKLGKYFSDTSQLFFKTNNIPSMVRTCFVY